MQISTHSYKELSPFKRLISFSIDFMICICIYLFFLYAFISWAPFYMVDFLSQNVRVFFCSTLSILVFLVFKDVFFKRSIGKIILGIKIVDRTTESKVSTKNLITRNLGTLVWPIELIFWSFNPNKTKIGGIRTNTKVVEVPRKASKSIAGTCFIVLFSGIIFLFGNLYNQALQHSEAYSYTMSVLSKDKDIYLEMGDFQDLKFLKGSASSSQARFMFGNKKAGQNYYLNVYLIKMEHHQWEVAKMEISQS